MKRLLFVAVMTFMVTGTANAQETPAPCGPASDLASDVGGNVAANSRCFELRMYTAEPEMNGKGGKTLIIQILSCGCLVIETALIGKRSGPRFERIRSGTPYERSMRCLFRPMSS